MAPTSPFARVAMSKKLRPYWCRVSECRYRGADQVVPSLVERLYWMAPAKRFSGSLNRLPNRAMMVPSDLNATLFALSAVVLVLAEVVTLTAGPNEPSDGSKTAYLDRKSTRLNSSH